MTVQRVGRCLRQQVKSGHDWYGRSPACLLASFYRASAAGVRSLPCRSTRREFQSLVGGRPETFQPALARFIAHKQALRPTEFRSLESILRQTRGVDDPERLKQFLYEEWRQRGLGYVLLVGDVDVLPVRYMVLDRITPAAFDYAFYPSDLYYGDIAKPDGSFYDWNARKDAFHASYFGEVRAKSTRATRQLRRSGLPAGNCVGAGRSARPRRRDWWRPSPSPSNPARSRTPTDNRSGPASSSSAAGWTVAG